MSTATSTRSPYVPPRPNEGGLQLAVHLARDAQVQPTTADTSDSNTPPSPSPQPGAVTLAATSFSSKRVADNGQALRAGDSMPDWREPFDGVDKPTQADDGLSLRRAVDVSLCSSPDDPKPHYGRLSSIIPRHENSDSGTGVLAEFAKGHKSLSMLAAHDVKNRHLVSFSYRMFVEVFIIHAFGPLAVPYVWFRYGWNCCVNMQLSSIMPPFAIGNYFWAMWVAAIVLYSVCDTPNITLSEVFMAASSSSRATRSLLPSMPTYRQASSRTWRVECWMRTSRTVVL